jgi:hypothetical protein
MTYAYDGREIDSRNVYPALLIDTTRVDGVWRCAGEVPDAFNIASGASGRLFETIDLSTPCWCYGHESPICLQTDAYDLLERALVSQSTCAR